MNIENSVVVYGVTNTENDEEIIDCLKHYGKIKNTILVSDETSSFYKNLIVEFHSSEPLTAMSPLLSVTKLLQFTVYGEISCH